MFDIECFSSQNGREGPLNISANIFHRLEISPASSLVLGLVFLPLALLAIVGNAATVFVYVKDPYKNLKTAPSNLLIMAMASVDFLNGGVSLLPSAALYILCGTGNTLYNEYITQWDYYSTTIKSTLELASLLLFVAMTIDRYFAVVAPLKYKSRVTKKRARRAVIVTGLYSLLVGLTFVITSNCRHFHLLMYCTHVLVSLVLLTVMNIKIIASIRKHSRQLMRSTAHSNACRLAFQRERKVTIAVSIVLVVFLLTFLPLFLQTIVSAVCSEASCALDVYAFQVAMYVSMALFHTASPSNPFLYSWRLDRYRQAFAYYVSKCACAMKEDIRLRPGTEENAGALELRVCAA